MSEDHCNDGKHMVMDGRSYNYGQTKASDYSK